ncbi:MAG TPA: TRIC cation channel family protein, partial [Saprospiraceae bacterium]|nr:TRIC cation channel family protein [Saprospiraceae bacterium]
MSLFAYTGATIGLMYNFNFGGVVFLAFLTATGGGIIRDIIMNDVPFVLTNDFYGTVSIIIGVILFTL